MTFFRAAVGSILICCSHGCTSREPAAAPAEPGAMPAAAPAPGANDPSGPKPAAQPEAPTAVPAAPVAPVAPAAEAPAAPAPAASPVAAEPSTAREHTATSKPAAAAPPAEAHAATAPSTAPAAVAEPCGEKGQPRCPLQAWMEDHLQHAVEAGDLPALAKHMTRAAAFAPDPGWNSGEQGWSTIAKAGAAAASSGDLDTAKQTCKTCHKTWRKKYKDEFRLRAVPN